MGNPFTSTSVTNYNSNPPSDDGSQTASNRVQWATHKTKLADPIKTAFDTSQTRTQAAFGKIVGGAGVTSTATDYTVSATDQGKLIKVTASATITTPDAATVGSPFVFALLNNSSGDITFAGNNPGTQQNIDGAASITIPGGNGLFCWTDGTDWFTAGQNFTKSFPPPSSFKNLSIKVTGNTGVTLAADYITVTDGARYQTLAFNKAINMGTTGAGALDAGTVAGSTWYAIWAIAKADGTASAIASTSSSSPTMPTGYTYKARVGWVRTASTAQLMGTWQFGKRARYVVSLAQTTVYPAATSGTAVSAWTAVPLGNFVPSTASHVVGFLYVGNGTGAFGAVAPDNVFSTNFLPTSPGPIAPIIGNVNNGGGSAGATVPFDLMLESTNIYWGTSSNGSSIAITGWEDNI